MQRQYRLARYCLFCQRYLVFDNNGRPGIACELNDALLINSGIHVALEHNTAGIFFNNIKIINNW